MSKDIVQEFYKETPFNYSEDVDFFKNSIIQSNQILEYEDLHYLLRQRKKFSLKPEINKVIEFGCGTGWLTNTMGFYYKKKVRSLDFTIKAVEIAKRVSQGLNTNAEFVTGDIFDYEDENLYDLVISLGVLHHTKDCKKAFYKASKFIKPGGYFYIGLYHLYGRRPMLNMLQSHARWHGNESAYNLFKLMNNDMQNQQHSYSWFRDQVLHPRETQHTIVEISEWLNDLGLDLISTSINKYKPIKNYSIAKLEILERELEAYSYNKNVLNLKFTPGYFTICAKKPIK